MTRRCGRAARLRQSRRTPVTPLSDTRSQHFARHSFYHEQILRDPTGGEARLDSLLEEEIMPAREITPHYIADHIRRVLKDGGSAPHSEDVQHFFKEVIKSRGWYTAELRKFAVRFRRSIVRERGMNFLVQVADDLFSGRVLEEKVMAVFLLEKQTPHFAEREFRLFASWL